MSHLMVTAAQRAQHMSFASEYSMDRSDMGSLQVKVACTQDVLNVMEIGQRNRSVAETKMNERSSRSHSVLTVIVDGLNNVTGIRTHGCLHLIDLAGKLGAQLLKYEAFATQRLLIQLAASCC